MNRIKLTAGGPKHVSECIRSKCPLCKETLLLHPSRWPNHIDECSKNFSIESLAFVYQTTENSFIKSLIERKLLVMGDLGVQ